MLIDIKPGKYKARALEGKIDKTKEKQTPYFGIMFEIEGGEKISWTGYLTPAALERTLESAAIAGWDGNYDDNGYAPSTSFSGTECEIEIADEEYFDSSGAKKIAKRVKWVNKPGGMWAKTQGSAKDILGGLDLKKELIVAKQRAGLSKPASAIKNYAPGASNPPPTQPQFEQDDAVPF
jgi:hypothetical protein